MIMKINQMQFPTLEAAWEGINEFLINGSGGLPKKNGGGIICYDNFIHIYKPWINPEFNFGDVLGYKDKKWSKLVSNYVDLSYLDLVKSEVQRRERKKSGSYNFTFHFANAHGSGKDCLISLSFCKRKGEKSPFVIFTTRASEVTCRLIFDFLLIQRIVEYVYGSEYLGCDILCYIPYMYITTERFLFYLGYKGVQVIKPDPQGEFSQYHQMVLKKFEEYTTRDPNTIKWKSHKRIALQIQRDEYGKALANPPDLFARDLTIPYKDKMKESDIEKLNRDYSKL